MYTNRVSLLFVAVVVLLAGCTGGGGVAPDAGGADAAADGAASASGGSGGAGDERSAGDDEFDLGDHERLLRDAGSFTVTWSYSGSGAAGVESRVAREFYVDLDAGRSYTVTSSATDGRSDGGISEQFVADGVTYVRSGTADAAAYSSYEGSAEPVATALALSQARAYGADDDLAFVGAETFDGVAVDRYELQTASEALILAGSAAAANAPGDLQVTNFEYVVLVDGDGLSRHESWTFSGRMDDGTEVSGSWEYSLTAVGSTTVDDPDWLDDARAQA